MNKEQKEINSLLMHLKKNRIPFMKIIDYFCKETDKEILRKGKSAEWASDIIDEKDRFRYGALMFKMRFKKKIEKIFFKTK